MKNKLIFLTAAAIICLFVSRAQAQTADDIFAAAALNGAVLKSATDSLNKRLGDLRRVSPDATSAFWARGFYGDFRNITARSLTLLRPAAKQALTSGFLPAIRRDCI